MASSKRSKKRSQATADAKANNNTLTKSAKANNPILTKPANDAVRAPEGNSSGSSSGNMSGDEVLDIASAIEMLNTSRPTFYRWLRSGQINGMKIGRQWRFYRKEIERFLKGAEPTVELPISIRPLIDDLTQKLETAKISWRPDPNAPETRQVVELIVRLSVVWSASDIHIATMIDEKSGQPESCLRYRIDGALKTISVIDRRLMAPLIQQFKTLAALDINEKTLPQDGRILHTFSDMGSEIDLRMNISPTAFGEAVTLRVLNRIAIQFDLAKTNFSDTDQKRLQTALTAPYGMILFTGPMGSGKTTTLYSAVKQLARPAVKTISVENPVEYALPYVNQISTIESKGLTFEKALTAALRSDPDIIIIGDIRTPQTLDIALKATLSGHLVLAQMHADGAADALQRLLDFGAERYNIADALRLIESQKLVRCLCPHCSQPCVPDPLLMPANRDSLSLDNRWKKSVGCDKCHQMGYRGRTIVAETIVVSSRIRQALRRGESMDAIVRIALEEGMTTMANHGLRLASEGKTSLSEIAFLK